MTDPAPTTSLPLTEKTHGGCACGEHDHAVPALDARAIPHAIRHATIFGALSGIRPGQQLDLIAPHNPLPLLAQITEREGEAVSWDYVQEGPEAWTLRFTRHA